MAELSDLERVVAIQDLQALQARRCLAVDIRDWSTHEALHTPGFRSWQGEEWVAEGAAVYTARVAAIHAHRASAHHLYTPVFAFDSSTRASGLWTMEDHVWWRQGEAEHWLHGFGFYDETYEKIDGRWLFASRRLRRHKVLMSPGADFDAPATPVA